MILRPVPRQCPRIASVIIPIGALTAEDIKRSVFPIRHFRIIIGRISIVPVKRHQFFFHFHKTVGKSSVLRYIQICAVTAIMGERGKSEILIEKGKVDIHTGLGVKRILSYLIPGFPAVIAFYQAIKPAAQSSIQHHHAEGYPLFLQRYFPGIVAIIGIP